ncbi:hypothetical protein PISL3812_05778 [Talaromyces islandicus]|uniref:RNase MRP protein 1 RNA binding domain-containing protein n=1 Tax=Talaromyces islandicus TaxID=28573 RepID=A0A0U1LZL2_TALIS|nr:hypothetical protein PISL3812_05778 [Talaromyces islandicus]
MDLSRVEEVSSKIHLIYHRNKNQHGPTAWWRWLSMLRRTLLKILATSATTQHDKQARLAKYLHAFIIPRCYVAFSTVVADGQFSTLGSVLLAALAQARDATSLGIDQTESSSDVRVSKTNEGYTDDLGVRISRSTETPFALHQKKTSESLQEAEPVLRQETSKSKLKKSKSKAKKTKSANAIDDIFNFID